MAADTSALPRLVTTGQLADWQKRGDVLLIDVRTDPFDYLKDHIPGAEYLNTETLRASDHGVPMQLMPASWYADLFSRLGVRRDRPVVIYSAGESHNIDATFLAWLLQGWGYPRVYLLDGGYSKWQLEQRPLAQHYPKIVPSTPPGGSFRPSAAGLADVRRAVETGSSVLVDARNPQQYAGLAGAQLRRGHIPGAINHFWSDDLEQVGFGHVWKQPAALRASYEAQGITPDKDIIVYCNSMTEATHVYFALHDLLGYARVRVYTGAWTQWAEREDLPVVAGLASAARSGRYAAARSPRHSARPQWGEDLRSG
ncbi:MAG TPA: sulfurtransferase [Gemmatimonadales bacterium]|nr:sulfurtransferase [Gemmatimonadales bacterium]